MNQLTLAAEEYEGVTGLVPFVDGSSLVDLVGAYESARGFTPAGGYGGLVPAYFRFGDLCDYYRGIEKRQWPDKGRVSLLACDCGEIGCWPLDASVTLTAHSVTWSNFVQPHRRVWSYADFGPFIFDRRQYEAAVSTCLATLTR
ncbi:hypothetical protein [Actinotalea ferrariae]|uniref:hypothetical protein n=1 Tax=Actinotalea ferrariae TaxID=1386098 RepID=UPI001C8C0C5C|nr:hypothetical protein [Actinotalea ferrariae]